MKTLRSLFICALFLSFSACGGGSSSSTPAPSPLGSPPDFTGEWHYVLLSGDSSTFGTLWGSGTANADGSSFLMGARNVDGTYTSPFGGPASWATAPDGTFTYGGFAGGITRLGDVAIGSAAAPDDPGIVIFLRKSGVFNTSTLSGSQHLVRLRKVLGTPDRIQSSHHVVAFDGVGGYAGVAGTSTRNVEGNVDSASFGSGSYGVTADGSFSTGNTEGGLLDGAIVGLAGGRVSNDDPLGFAFVSASVGMSVSRFRGRYAVVGLQYDYGSTAYRSTHAILEADGAGGGTVVGSQNVQGTAVPLANAGIAATVSSNGTLELTLPGGDTLRGGIAPDGRIVVLGGATQAGSDPAMYVLVRLD